MVMYVSMHISGNLSSHDKVDLDHGRHSPVQASASEEEGGVIENIRSGKRLHMLAMHSIRLHILGSSASCARLYTDDQTATEHKHHCNIPQNSASQDSNIINASGRSFVAAGNRQSTHKHRCSAMFTTPRERFHRAEGSSG